MTHGNHRLRVLVVDDERAILDGLACWLGQRGFSVATAFDLRSATEAAENYRPDVILLDVRLGAEDGLRLIDLLRERDLSIPCVVLTGCAGPFDGFRARDLGVVSLIEKPSSPDGIADALRRATTSAPQHRDARSSSTPGNDPSAWAQPLPFRIRKAIDYIDANFADANLSAEDVAAHIGITPEHLSRLFDESLGKGPSTLINQLRIRRASQLLQEPRLNLGEIASLCGYRSTRQLNRWFKLFCGISPALRRLDPGASHLAKGPSTGIN